MQRHDLRRNVGKDDPDIAAKEIVHGGRDAAVGHVQDIEPAGAPLEQLGRDVGDRADAARAVRQLAWISLGIGDQLLDRVDWQRRGDRDRGRGGRHDRGRADVFQRIVGAIVAALAQHQRAGAADQQKVAVGRLLRHVVEANRRAAAGTVLDDDGAERGLDPVRPDAADYVMHPASRGRHHEMNLLGRITGLSAAREWRQEAGDRRGSARYEIAPAHDDLQFISQF